MTMTPRYNSSEYYKKMLDLQERLRKSEEERIRLEERFTLLEHESRSRHEACINRLRMRYIDFLEEQQARDERNHQLLGALDRIDSSLAMMTAKTDRLGALRKQYESTLRAPYENRRPNGSVTGDSGVVSQKDERQLKFDESYRANGNEPSISNRGGTIIHRVGGNRTNDSSCQVRPGSSYGNAWSGGINRDSTQMHQPSFAFSRLSQGGASLVRLRDTEPSLCNVDRSPEEPWSIRRSKNALDSIESIPRSFRYGNNVSLGSSFGDYRNVDPSRYQRSEYTFWRNNDARSPAANTRYDTSVIRDLANSGAYESVKPAARLFEESPRRSGDSNSYEQVCEIRNLPGNDFDASPSRNSMPQPVDGSAGGDRKILKSSPPTGPKLSEILRQELGDDEEYVGSMVENQLERYISKIRSLHRNSQPHSLEEIDHEENTSGDLLNVTLSDDGLDLPAEEKTRERLYPRELGSVLALAEDLAERTATSAINVANNIYQDIPAGDVPDSHGRGKNNAPVSATDTVHQLGSINQPRDDSHADAKRPSYEKFASLAKNGISADAVKPNGKLASGTDENIRDIAKSTEGRGENDGEALGQTRANEMNDESKGINDAVPKVSDVDESQDEFEKRLSDLRQLEMSRYRPMTAEQLADDDNLLDTVEELLPWNLSALERRVQEIMLNDEAQDDFVKKSDGTNFDDVSMSSAPSRGDISRTNHESDRAMHNDGKIDEFNRKNDATGIPDDTWKDDQHCQGRIPASASTEEENSSQECVQEKPEVSPEGGIAREENYDVGNSVVDPSVDCEAKEAETYVQDETPEETHLRYAYGADGQYQEDLKKQYEQYDSDNDTRNERIPGEEGHYSEQQYIQEDNVQNPQRNYDSGQQGYIEDPNQQEYIQDPNQGYVQDPNLAEYVESSNWQEYNEGSHPQEYAQDPNQQYDNDFDRHYITDPNKQYPADSNQRYPDNHTQEYANDIEPQYPADSSHRYSTDHDQQYPTDPNQQYPEDSILEYSNDPNQQYDADPPVQYSADPNQQYPMDPVGEYPIDPNQQYPMDPTGEYPIDPNQQYSGDPMGQYSTDPEQQYSGALNQNYVDDPGEDYSANVGHDQQYSLDPDETHENATKDYPHQETPVYPNAASFNQAEEGSTVALDRCEEKLQEDSERTASASKSINLRKEHTITRKNKDVIKSILESDTDSTIERNVSNTESDFDFN